MAQRHDVVVVGGGIVGLATAWRLLEGRKRPNVVVLERNPVVGDGQSSHNSGVLHAGLYYATGSAKARWSRSGKEAFERFADEHGIPVERTGKVVAAVDREELPRLHALAGRARDNGVPIEELDAAGVREHEPYVTGAIAGLWSPETAVTDFRAACEVLSRLIVERGGEVRTGVEVVGLGERPDEVRVATTAGELEARTVVVCAGVRADRMARLQGIEIPERIVPFRGAWLVLREELGYLVRGNVYPVPLPGLPFLGVHLTRRIDGQVWIGPNAVLALSREGRGPWSFDADDVVDTLRFRGTWELARRHLGTAALELLRDRVIPATIREVRRYIPAITAADVSRGPWGVRAQLVAPNGDLVDDFLLREAGRVLHVLNAPSPAATASLSIGAELAERTLARLD